MKAGRTLGRCAWRCSVALGIAVTEAVLQLVPALVPLTIRVTLATKGFSTIRPHPRCGFVYRPDLDTLYSPTAEMSYRFRTVRAPDPTIGLRDDGWSGRPWAVALGDSFTSGMGVELEETWAERLEAKLGRDVVNLGVDGYSSLHETALLRAVGLPLAPAVALFLVNFNDPGDCVKFIEAAPLHAREVATFTEAVKRAPRRRPIAAAGDPATTLAGWVAPLPRRAVPRLVARASRPKQGPEGVVSFADEARVEMPLEAGKGFTLAVRFVAPAAGGAAAKGKKATRLCGRRSASGLDLLLSDGRVRVYLGGVPTSSSRASRSAPERRSTVAVVRRRRRDGVVLPSTTSPDGAAASPSRPLKRCAAVRRTTRSGCTTAQFEGNCTRAEVGGGGDGGRGARTLDPARQRGALLTVDRPPPRRRARRRAPRRAVATRAVARDRPAISPAWRARPGSSSAWTARPPARGETGYRAAVLGDVEVGRDGDRRGCRVARRRASSRRLGAGLSRLATRAADGRAPEPGPSAAARRRSGAVDRETSASSRTFGLRQRGARARRVRVHGGRRPPAAGRGGVRSAPCDEPRGARAPRRSVEAGRSTLYLLEMLHLFRRDGLRARRPTRTTGCPSRAGRSTRCSAARPSRAPLPARPQCAGVLRRGVGTSSGRSPTPSARARPAWLVAITSASKGQSTSGQEKPSSARS
jgi:hypothetical protein